MNDTALEPGDLLVSGDKDALWRAKALTNCEFDASWFSATVQGEPYSVVRVTGAHRRACAELLILDAGASIRYTLAKQGLFPHGGTLRFLGFGIKGTVDRFSEAQVTSAGAVLVRKPWNPPGDPPEDRRYWGKSHGKFRPSPGDSRGHLCEQLGGRVFEFRGTGPVAATPDGWARLYTTPQPDDSSEVDLVVRWPVRNHDEAAVVAVVIEADEWMERFNMRVTPDTVDCSEQLADVVRSVLKPSDKPQRWGEGASGPSVEF